MMNMKLLADVTPPSIYQDRTVSRISLFKFFSSIQKQKRNTSNPECNSYPSWGLSWGILTTTGHHLPRRGGGGLVVRI